VVCRSAVPRRMAARTRVFAASKPFEIIQPGLADQPIRTFGEPLDPTTAMLMSPDPASARNRLFSHARLGVGCSGGPHAEINQGSSFMPVLDIARRRCRVLADFTRFAASVRTRPASFTSCLLRSAPASLHWLAARLPSGALPPRSTASQCAGHDREYGAKTNLLARIAPRSQNYAGWLDGPLAWSNALEAAAVAQILTRPSKARSEVAAWWRRDRPFRAASCPYLCSRSYVGGVHRGEIDAGAYRTAASTMQQALAQCRACRRPRVRRAPLQLSAISRRHIGQVETPRTRRSQDRHRPLPSSDRQITAHF